jgi:four helix bundle protein
VTPAVLRDRTKKFALQVILLARALPTDPITANITGQLTAAATSVAANYRAVCRARSRADFINKLSITIEEADESALWLEILTEAGMATREATQALWQEADELTRILVRSRETARHNRDPRSSNAQLAHRP